MIPILFESTATDFTSNGIGRLSDIISCKVTEERNGIYECEFEYPTDGKRYEDIIEGRIIVVKHDDTDDLQPFDIYGHSAPIDGIVTFYAHHISYRLGEITVKPFSASSCTEALQKLKQNSIYANPFEFWTNKSVNADYVIDQPVNLKEYLGGTEGSILDIFGTGEYEWDKFTVKFHLNRGTNTDVQIRYGKNLADLQDEEDWSGCYTAVVPYWFGQDSETDEDVLVTLDEWYVTSGQSTYGGREIIVPMDLSGEWQDPPTQAQLRQTAVSRLMLGEGWMPSKSVKVDFVHLWQTEEYAEYAPLQRVKLCDTVTVIYPKLGMEFTKKVVEAKYDVLLERYDELTLGESTTNFANLINTETAKQVAEAKLYLRKLIKNTNYALQQNMEDEIQRATDLITGGQGGYAVWGFNANGYPEELFFLDQPSVETAVNVLRINKNGIGFSTSGVNGTYQTAWTIDGHFVADFITAGTLNANLIRAGVLSDTSGNNYWNLDTGELRISWTGTNVGSDTLGTAVNKASRAILDNANAYGLGWRVNASSFTNTSNGECYYHGFATDGTAADIDGWVYWNGETVAIPRGYGINPNATMPFDTVIYSVYRLTDNKYHDVVWMDSSNTWEGNTYTATSGTNWTPSARTTWTWDEANDIILSSYLIPSAEGAIYGAQLFTPPKKYSELAEKVESKLHNELSTFATTVTERLDDMQEQLDGVVDTYYYSYAPTLTNEPASEWTTDADKTNHIGDMFYDISTGKVYRWVSDNTNLITYPYVNTTKTASGITWTDNGDKTVTVNGTATANSEFTLHGRNQGITLEEGIYEFSGTPSGGGSSKYGMYINRTVGSSGQTYGWDYGNGLTFEVTDSTAATGMACRVMNGTTVDNLTFTPTIKLKYGWKEIPDTEAQQALQLASEAKDTADHKRRVFIVTPYVPYDQGDIWMQGANGDILVCLEGKTSTESYSQTDWGKLNKYTDEATALAIAEEQVSSIEIGGRNLLYDTNAPTLGAVDGDGARYWSSQTALTNGTAEWVEIEDSPVPSVKYGAKFVCNTTGGDAHGLTFYQVPAGEIRDFIDWKNGQIYTFSCWAKSSVAGATIGIHITTSSYMNPPASQQYKTIDVANKWTRLVWTFTYTGDDNAYQLFWTDFTYGVVGTVYMCGFQLEVGNVATDWTDYPRTETTYSGRNLIRNTNNVDLSEFSTRPNINGYYNDGTHYGNIEYSSGTTTASEHGIKTVVTSATYPFIQFGTSSTTASSAEMNGTFGLEVGQQYTFSFDYEYKLYSGADTTNVYYFATFLYQWSGTAWQAYECKLIDSIYVAERGTVKSGRGFFTFTVPDASISLRIRPYTNTASLFASGDYIELKNLKLEKGNKATDWSAAPEDIAGDITDVYVKSGGRNYITGTGTPYVRAIGINDTYVNGKTQWNTYLDQTLEDLGFAVGDKITVSFDWEVSDVIDSTYGTFHLELFGKTSSSDYGYLAWLNPNITVSALNLSGHCTNTLTLNSTTIKGYSVIYRVDTMTATLKIYNLKLEKGETESSWKVAPEDASIPASGANMLRGTDASRAIGTGQWDDGTWRSAGSGTGTRTVIDIDDANIPKIKHGWKITATSVVNSLGDAVALGQNSVPHIESGKHYVLSCYAKGTGYLIAGAGVSSFIYSYIRLDNVTAWTRYEFPIVLPNLAAYMNLTTKKTNVFFGVTGVDADISICTLKMEEGLVATEWGYADEDVIDEISDLETDLKTQIDGKIETFYQSNDPSADWTTTALKTEHTGDLWYRTSDHSTWRWTGSAWQEQVASDAVFDEIDGKTTVYYGTTSGTYTGVETGDYLVDSTDGSTYRYNGSGWTKVTDYSTAVQGAKDYADGVVTAYDSSLNQQAVFNKLTNNGQTQGIYLSNGKVYINATYISTGTLSASRISGGTLSLGGASNGNGILKVYDASGTEVGSWTNTGLVTTGAFQMRISGYASGKYVYVDMGEFTVYDSQMGNVTRQGLRLSGNNAHTNQMYFVAQNPSTSSGHIYTTGDFTLEAQGSSSTLFSRLRLNSSVANLHFDKSGAGNFINLSDTSVYFGCTSSTAGWRGMTLTGNSSSTTATLNVNGSIVGKSKSNLVETDNYDKRLLFCYEMPTAMYGDIGEGKTDEDGICYVEIDDIFREVSNFDSAYYVILQKRGDGDIWVEEKSQQYFIVKGTPNIEFDWEIKVRQKINGDGRLEEYERWLEADNGELYEPPISAVEELENYYKEQEDLLYETA